MLDKGIETPTHFI